VHPNETPEQLKKKVNLEIPVKGEGLTGVLHGIDQFLDHSVKTHHPNFLTPFWAGFNPAAFGGEMMSTLAQTSMYTYELAPIATLIEQTVIDKMASKVGFKNADGLLTTGGSNGNMIGLLMAR